MVVEHPLLQDGSTEPWPEEAVASHVRDFVNKYGIQTVRAAFLLLRQLSTAAASDAPRCLYRHILDALFRS